MLKKISLMLAFLFLLAIPAHAAWTITTTVSANSAHYIKFKVVCTSDGDALTATDLVAEFEEQTSARLVRGLTAMLLKVVPGTGAVIPGTTINITLTDEEEDALWADTGISKDAATWHSLADDINAYPMILDKLYLAINDIGDEGVQVTLYFHCWIE
jgi:hypothetical protein